jgi:hypothetical protein
MPPGIPAAKFRETEQVRFQNDTDHWTVGIVSSCTWHSVDRAYKYTIHLPSGAVFVREEDDVRPAANTAASAVSAKPVGGSTIHGNALPGSTSSSGNRNGGNLLIVSAAASPKPAVSNTNSPSLAASSPAAAVSPRFPAPATASTLDPRQFALMVAENAPKQPSFLSAAKRSHAERNASPGSSDRNGMRGMGSDEEDYDGENDNKSSNGDGDAQRPPKSIKFSSPRQNAHQLSPRPASSHPHAGGNTSSNIKLEQSGAMKFTLTPRLAAASASPKQLFETGSNSGSATKSSYFPKTAALPTSSFPSLNSRFATGSSDSSFSNSSFSGSSFSGNSLSGSGFGSSSSSSSSLSLGSNRGYNSGFNFNQPHQPQRPRVPRGVCGLQVRASTNIRICPQSIFLSFRKTQP